MLIRKYCFVLLVIIGNTCSCQQIADTLMKEKNKCYDEKLKTISRSKIYQEAFIQLRDTFDILKGKKEYFGVPDYVENRLDKAFFLKKDSSEAVFIVLQRMADTLYMFGSARIMYGIRENASWKFSVGITFNFEKDYFDLFKTNSFENISLLARYAVLSSGNIRLKGCEIDEHYWFVEMK